MQSKEARARNVQHVVGIILIRYARQKSCPDAWMSITSSLQVSMKMANKSAHLDPRMGPAGATELSSGMIPFFFE